MIVSFFDNKYLAKHLAKKKNILVLLVFCFALTLWLTSHMATNAYNQWNEKLSAYVELNSKSVENELLSINSYFSDILDGQYNSIPKQRFNKIAGEASGRFTSIENITLFTINKEVIPFPASSKSSVWNKKQLDSFISAGGFNKGELLNIKTQKIYAGNTDYNASIILYFPISNSTYKNSKQASNYILVVIDIAKIASKVITDNEKTSLKVKILDNIENGKIILDANTSPEINVNLLSVTQYSKLNLFNTNWELSWTHSQHALGGINLLSTIIVFLINSSVLGIIAWILFGNQSVSARIMNEVSQRTRELETSSRRFKVITDNAYDLIALVTKDGRIEYTNNSFYRVLGLSNNELNDKFFIDYIHNEDKDSVREAFFKGGERTLHNEISLRMRHKGGKWIYLEGVARKTYGTNWDVENILINCHDISSKKQYADELARSEQRFKDFADSSADWLWETNKELEFTYMSPGIIKTLGFSADKTIGRLKFKNLFNDNNNDTNREIIEARTNRSQPFRDVELWTLTKDKNRICLRVSGIPIFDEDGIFIGYRGAASNVTANKIDRENIYKMATTDNLTGLLNRARFNEELEKALRLAQRHNSKGVLLFIDLDQFKGVNDTYGHEAGDALIKGVADILAKEVRSSDVVARLGGDEFGIIMHDIELSLAKIKVQKIIDALHGLKVKYQEIVLNVTMSVGMISYPQGNKDSANLLMSADLAMYRAKDLGRNRLYIDDDNNTDIDSEGVDLNPESLTNRKNSLKEQLKWVDRLRKALQNGDFEIHYQPLVPAVASENPSFEALIRLRDEKGNVGAPGIFIDAAEHFGLIQQLDLSVFERCLQTYVAMKKKGMVINTSVNLSGKSISDEDVIKKIKQVLKKYPTVDPKDFTFEITETTALHDPKKMVALEKVQEYIEELRELGFSFSLDDFGTGFSSFNYIKHLHVDNVKIDGSYILTLEYTHQDRLFVKLITDLAKGMDMNTTAEFVENEKILSIIKDLGVDKAQGYHLCKPEKDIESLYVRFKGKVMDDFLSS